MCGVRRVAVLAAVLSGFLAAGCGQPNGAPTSATLNLKLTPPAEIAEADHGQVRALCGACHHYPPPDCLPRFLWDEEVRRGFRFYEESRLALNAPPLASVIRYYENRAPAEFPSIPATPPTTDPSCRFERAGFRPPNAPLTPAIANVRCVHLFDDKHVEILVCEMLRGQVWLYRPHLAENPWLLLTEQVAHPAHAEVVDLDQDGVKDLIVADLGDFFPTDEPKGSVVWLRGDREGKFHKHVLLSNVGRVADVQPADFNGDGKLDLVVAEFGWQRIGNVLVLENQTRDYQQPQFAKHVIDPRHGAIHVPVTDLNGDGKPDFVAVLSQETEKVVAFLNEGGFAFTPKVIFDGPHPAYGSSGVQLVDFDGDGKTDVLYTNGDSLDRTILRHYHGIHLLMNRGTFPFEDHFVGPMYGVHRALAADFEGKGKMDVVATSFLPEPGFTDLRQDHDPDAIVLFRQTGPLEFTRHVLTKRTCDHATADVADVDGDGRPDLVVGNFSLLGTQRVGGRRTVSHPTSADFLEIWRNLGVAAGGSAAKQSP